MARKKPPNLIVTVATSLIESLKRLPNSADAFYQSPLATVHRTLSGLPFDGYRSPTGLLSGKRRERLCGEFLTPSPMWRWDQFYCSVKPERLA